MPYISLLFWNYARLKIVKFTLKFISLFKYPILSK